MLQTASAFKQKNLTANDIESISGVIPDEVIRRIDKVLQQNADGGFGEVQILAQDLILDGFDVQKLLYQVLDFYVASVQPDLRKAKISEIIAETDIKLL
jgi:DNA polymerase III gamma/tau subunit